MRHVELRDYRDSGGGCYVMLCDKPKGTWQWALIVYLKDGVKEVDRPLVENAFTVKGAPQPTADELCQMYKMCTAVWEKEDAADS